VNKVAILAQTRTPIGSFMGSLASFKATDLGSFVIKDAVSKSKIDNNQIDQVIMGQVLQAGAGQAPARQAALGAQISNHVACTTVNKVCGSGLKAIMMGADAIRLSESQIVIAGGMESMSNALYALPKARAGFRMGDQKVIDLMIHDGLFDPYGQAHMGGFGDLCAKNFGFTREDQDKYAHESYQRAIKAQNGLFDDEITKVLSLGILIDKDEEPSRYRPEKFKTLKPAFGENGTVTAANASKVSDGAAALVLIDDNKAKRENLAITARILSYATFAHEPALFTTAPAFAIRKALKEANLSSSDIDLYEINEAFSVVALVAMKELSLKHEQVNIFGGAVSLGHPIGSSGARLMVTLLNALKKRQKSLGCVALCIGGGEAVAMIVERVE
jgi:acetyl-CoA C-acetyltransferase